MNEPSPAPAPRTPHPDQAKPANMLLLDTLSSAQAHARYLRYLDRDADRADARDRAHAILDALKLAHTQARALGLNPGRGVGYAVAFLAAEHRATLARRRGNDLDFEHASAVAADLFAAGLFAGDLDCACRGARAVAADLDYALERTTYGVVDDLDCVLERAIEHALDVEHSRARLPSGRHPAIRVAPSARRLVVAATRLLPAADRARYAEEYATELWEIAYAGAGRRQQIRYALRQFTCAPHLRSALRSPRQKRATP